MNHVCLVGRLTADPEIRYSQQGMAFASFTIACDRRLSAEKRNDPNAQTADFPRIQAVGKTAEFIQKYFFKGMRIGIEGRIQTGSYTDRNGNKVYTTDVFAENVEFVESKGNSGGGGNQRPQNYQHNNSYSQPQYNAPMPPAPSAGSDPMDGFMNIPDGIDEELPFT